MTEQEKQAIRERLSLYKHMEGLANHFPHPVTGIPWNPFKRDRDDIERLLDALDERDREVERLGRDIAIITKGYTHWKTDSQRLRKELIDLMTEMHEQLDFERWAESKGYGYDEYFKAIDSGEWDSVGDKALAGEETE